MASTVQVLISPASAPTAPHSGVVAEIAYDADATADGRKGDPQPVLQTVRIALDDGLTGSAQLQGVAGTSVRGSVLSADGVALVARVLPIDGERVELVLSAADVARIADGGQVLPSSPAPVTVTRTARLLPTGSTVPDFAHSALAVATVGSTTDLDAAGLTELLAADGGRLVTSVELTAASTATVARIPWSPSHLGVDGSFTATLPTGESVGWLWWLAGPRSVLGFVPDDLRVPREPLVLPLPAASSVLTDGPTPPPAGADRGCGTAVRADASEAELVNNPGVYREDPGAFCRPFSNPERVVSEKSFSVIARVTQPALGPLGSRRLRSLDVLQLDGDHLPARPPTTKPTGVLNRIRGRAATSRPVATAFAKLDLLPQPHALIRRYDELLAKLPAGRRALDANHPLQWEDDIAQYQAAEIALGHILEFRVRTRSNGYSLGTVAKTLTLAPRQARRIQKVEWRRSERARRSERTQLADQTNDSVVRERAFDDAVAAHLEEWASGGSSSDTEAVAGGIGFAVPGVVGGIGGGAASAHSTSHAEGGRDATASESQRLRDAIRRHGDALRRFESTVVTEVTQEETVTGTTEVIRNLNYAHSLTVIYYQILRHLAVATEFAGVRQCVFVPFALRPFDVQRAYRWREAITTAIRTTRYGRALRHLKDVATGFATSDIDPGTRGDQPLTSVRGSLYVTIGVERPRDDAEGKFDEARWQVAQPLLTLPALGIFSGLAALVAAQRDIVFQREHAPDMAARWADRLAFTLPGSRVLTADCTLATRYRFNQPVRVDFTVPAEELIGLRRRDLTQLRVAPALDLPPGSVANLTRMSIVYSTARFEHAAEARTGTNDLVKPVSGLADAAVVTLPLDRWEQVDERLELIRAVQELVEHLNEHVEYYHKAIWWRMDRDRLLMMLDGCYVPGSNDVSVASIVDREPIAIIGNSVVYRVGAASFVPMGKVATPEDLRQVYADRAPTTDPLLISLPTDGLYAQTIMDECAALEEHYGTTDWALSQPDLDLGTLDATLLASRQAAPTELTPTPFPSTIINLQNAPDAPAPQGLAGVLGAVTTANAFRDMAGLAGTQANARAALETAAGLATSFGGQAAALELAKLAKAEQATKDADRKLAAIKNAKDKGLTDDAAAAAQATAALAAMNPDSMPSDAPHTDPAVNAAIDAAATTPGSTIEATNSEGTTKVTIGKEDGERPLIVDVRTSGAARSFGPPSDLSGATKLAVRGKNLPSGSTLRWSIPPAAAGRYTITQSTAGGVSEVTISGIRPGRTDIDVEALDPSGTKVASMKVPLSIPQFITVDDDNADFNAFLTARTLPAIDGPIRTELRAVVDDLVGRVVNVRVVWASLGGAVPAHVTATNVTTARIRNTDPSGGRDYGSTVGGASGPDVGDTVSDEHIEIYPDSYFNSVGAGSDINTAVNDIVNALTALQVSDPEYEAWLIRFFGRLIGESLSHEMYHALLPVPFTHNVDVSGNDVDTGELMDRGRFRSLLRRTGISVQSGDPADLLDHLTDLGRGTINRLGGANLTSVQTTNPVPPVPPFAP